MASVVINPLYIIWISVFVMWSFVTKQFNPIKQLYT